ncbi:MAG TPA: hypothetical protein VL172_11060 [Kofleriaceae bacterium]|jgi:hypothetical protein|nr:hypothetical protein [Kofleriaceae bacterium]
MTEADQFLYQQLEAEVQPGERIQHTAYVTETPPWSYLFVILPGLLTRAYFAVLTDRRLLLIKTRVGVGSVVCENLGVQRIERSAIREVTGGKRLMRVRLQDGGTRRFFARSPKAVSGTLEFFAYMPSRFGVTSAT